MSIDLRTLILIIGLTHLIQMLVFLNQYKVNKSIKGPGWWLLWTIAEVIGFFIILLRDIPSLEHIVILFQNITIFAGVTFIYVGVQRFLDSPINIKMFVGLLSCYLLAHLFFVFVVDNIQLRTLVFDIAISVMAFATAASFLKSKAALRYSSVVFNMVVFLIHGLIFTYRSVMVILGADVSQVFSSSLFNLVQYFDALIVALLWTFGFIIMVNQKLNYGILEAKLKFEKIFNTSPDAVVITRMDDGMFVDVNDRFCGFLGYSKEYLVGKSSLGIDLYKNPNDRDKIVKLVKEKGECAKFEAEFLKKDKSLLTGLLSAKTILINDVPHIISFIHDISERKASEQKIIAFSNLIKNSRNEIYIFDPETLKFSFVNKSALENLGYSPEEILNMTPVDIKPEYTLNLFKEAVSPLLSGEIEIMKFETVHQRKDGTLYPVDITLQLSDFEGKQMFTAIILDSTHRKMAEKKLIESEILFRSVFENSPIGKSITRIDGTIQTNKAFADMLGYTLEEFQNKNWREITHPDDIEKSEKIIETLMPGKQESVQYEKRYIHKNGSIRFAEVRTSLYQDHDNKPQFFITLVMDITDRKNAEILLQEKSEEVENKNEELARANEELADALRKAEENEAKYKELFVKMMNAFALHEMIFNNEGEPVDYKFLEVNPAWEKVVGINSDMVINKTIREIMPDIEESWIQVYGRIVKTGIAEEFDDYNKATEKYYHIYAYRPEPGKFAVLFNDITERKKAEILLQQKSEEIEAQNEELAQTNEELSEALGKAEESDRLKSAFLANMSHEIRTPMNGILGFSELLKNPDLTSEEKLLYISMIEKGGERMLNIITDLIDISKVEAGLMEVALSETNINEQIDYVYTFFKPEAEKKGLQMVASKPLPNSRAIIKTDKEKVYSVLTNLVKNALKYCDTGTVEVGYDLKDEEIEFFVKDTGIGIPEEWKEKIFDRFIQTDVASKRASQGAGLGLAISKAFVEMLGGKIRVESTPGAGSVFCFTIPHRMAELQKEEGGPNEPASKVPARIRDIKVLIAEDDPASAIYLDLVVKSFASAVYKTKTGIEAVQVLGSHPDTDLVLMDVQLPEMDGIEATQKIREFNKDVIIIAQTAYGFAADREKVLKAGCNDYISKPIKKEELLSMIEKYFKN